MAGPLSVCTKEQQHSAIRFLWSEGVSGAEIHRRLSVQYGNGVLPQRGVYEWIEKLKNSRKVLRMKVAVHAWLAAQSKTFFSEGIKKLVQRWKKCIEKQGDYVEKL